MHRILGTNDSPDSLAAAAMREWALLAEMIVTSQ